MRTKTTKEGLQVEIERQIRLADYSPTHLPVLIANLQKASQGLSDCHFRLNHVQLGGYDGECEIKPTVVGWRLATEEDYAQIAREERVRKATDDAWLERQREALERAGYKVEKGN